MVRIFASENEIMLHNRQIRKPQKKKPFKNYHDSGTLLGTFEFFKLRDDESVIAEFFRPWKRSPGRGTIIDKRRTTNKDLKLNLNELKTITTR